MPRPTSRSVLAPLVLALFALPRIASAIDHDAGIWLVNQARVSLGDRLSFHTMFQSRWSDEIETYERTVFRPWISYAWPGRGHVAAGYDLHEFEEPDRHEQRAWQRIAVEHGFDRVTLLGHVWIEERFFQNTDNVAVRARINAGAAYDLGDGYGALLRNEIFFDLNGTTRIRNAGLGENQLVAALSKALPGHVVFEIGYLQQYLDRRGNADVYNHFLMTGFSWRTPQLADWF
ncbi:MAG: DUF2490 domain-containing protein [Myxococcota bacterium]